MEPEKIKALAVLLGIDPIRLSQSLQEFEEKGTNEDSPGYFYYNPDVIRKLHNIDSEGLRKLVMPDLSRLRR